VIRSYQGKHILHTHQSNCFLDKQFGWSFSTEAVAEEQQKVLEELRQSAEELRLSQQMPWAHSALETTRQMRQEARQMQDIARQMTKEALQMREVAFWMQEEAIHIRKMARWMMQYKFRVDSCYIDGVSMSR
jgi:hypothetical protein